MSWDHASFNDNIERCARDFDRAATASLCDQLILHLQSADEPYPAMHAGKVLSTLRRKRFFALLQAVADALIRSGQDAPEVQRQYAQALIEDGRLSAALGILRSAELELELRLRRDHRPELVSELGEVRGLVGRAHKQIYVEAEEPGERIEEHLRRAVRAYYEWYAAHGAAALWHGINAVALLARAERDGVEVAGYPDAREVARDVLDAIEARAEGIGAQAGAERLTPWDQATAMEAFLALGDVGQAAARLGDYLEGIKGADRADAFEFGSTLRQLEEVWGLDSTTAPGSRLLAPLRAALLRQEGAGLTLSGPEVGATEEALESRESREQYEKNFGHEGYRDLEWLDTARDRCLAVARLADYQDRGQGTGFLVRGRDLDERYGDAILLLTNSHVIAPEDAATGWPMQPALYEDEAKIGFEALGAGDEHWSVGKILAHSPPWELDFSLVELDRPVPIERACPLRTRRLRVNRSERLYVIGHPRGESLKYSLYDNLLLDVENPRVHYRTPTEPGSSGSPVFDSAWELVAIHHKGHWEMRRLHGRPGTYEANEGILIPAIRDRLRGTR